MVLLSFLTACGGSDSDGSNFTKNEPEAEEDVSDNEKEAEKEPETEPEVSPEALGLGFGIGTNYIDKLANTGLSSSEFLSASGSATITVNVVNLDNNNSEYLGLKDIYFISTCSQVGLAEFSPSVVQASGIATATYQDKGCGKEFGSRDNIVVYIGEKDEEGNVTPVATARASINVAAAQIGAIQYVASSASVIALNGYGTEDHPSSTSVEFQVVDESGNAMPDRKVFFTTDHPLGSASLSLDNAVTDKDGTVRVILNSGNVPGTMRIKASVNVNNTAGDLIKTINTSSPAITLATSLADEDSFTLGASLYNTPGWDWNGSSVTITARLGDHYQNPVIDGTAVYFRATGGLIQESCITVEGECSVKWTSQNPRPVDGIVTITAQTRGQGGFQDSNGNGLFDIGESFTSFAESYVDANGNGLFDEGSAYQPDLDIDNDGVNDFSWSPTAYRVNVEANGSYSLAESNFYEEFIDTNRNGVLDSSAGYKFQGDNCSQAALDNGHCADQVDMVKTLRLQMSASADAYIEGPFLWSDDLGRYDTSKILTCLDVSSAPKDIAWRVSDSVERRNHLPSGSRTLLNIVDTKMLSTSTGEIKSKAPVPVLPVWESYYPSLSGEEKRYTYLKQRGHLVTAQIVRPDKLVDVSPTGLGNVVLKVVTVNGGEFASNPLKTDFLGYGSTLVTDLQGVVSSVDVRSNAQDYTLIVRNTCGYGLEGGKLVITADNGVVSNVSGSGNALSAPALTTQAGVSVITADIDATSDAATVVKFSIAKDTSSSTGNLSVTLKVKDPDFDFDISTTINNYLIMD